MNNTTPSPSSPTSSQEPVVPMKEKGEVSEFAKTAIYAVLLALAIRSLFFEPFNIPSGSMLPTLQVGDYLFVSKMSYGYSRYSFPLGMARFDGRVMEKEPKRGDVAVFRLPTNPSIDYIKRVIGLPGETIQVIQGRLYINGEIVEREPLGYTEDENNLDLIAKPMMEYIETLPGGIMHRIYEVGDNQELDNTIEYKVPAGHYFMMGDNRDNSMDSRVSSLVGYVPFDNLVGRADLIFFSAEEDAVIYNPLTWFGALRFDRMLDKIEPIKPAKAS